MNRTLALSATLILGCVAGATSSQLVVAPLRAGDAAPGTTLPRWQYSCGPVGTPERLNEAGANGWELVNAYWSSADGTIYCFKRPL